MNAMPSPRLHLSEDLRLRTSDACTPTSGHHVQVGCSPAYSMNLDLFAFQAVKHAADAALAGEMGWSR